MAFFVDRRAKRIATDIQVMFPQFDFDTILAVVKAEVTNEASVARLVELDDQRNRDIAEQFAKNSKRQEQMREENKRHLLAKSHSKSSSFKSNAESVSLNQPELYSGVVESQNLNKSNSDSKDPVSKELEGNLCSKDEGRVISLPSYSDLSSPAVDLLLRGYGGREKHAPEKNTDFSLPSHVVEDTLKRNISDSKMYPEASGGDLSAKKEARRKARQERRERQQKQRLEAAKLQQEVAVERRQRTARNKNGTSVTTRSSKEKPSESTAILHTLETSSESGKPQEEKRTMHGASSGYDTGSERNQDGVDNLPREAMSNNTKKGDHVPSGPLKAERKGVKYACGTKYDSSSSHTATKNKPSKYESKKSKRYNRRKTLNYDHYSTDQQDRTSL